MRVAVTGNIGSGKSTLARRLAERGAVLVDADVLARRVVDELDELRRQLAHAFGGDLLDDEGHLDRRQLARRALTNEDGRQRLEAIVRPYLQPLLETELVAAEQAAATAGALVAANVVVLDAPLVFEWGIESWFDRIYVVSTDAETAAARVASSRDLSVDEVQERQRAQFSAAQRRGAFANVDNNGTLDDLRSMADQIWDDLVGAAGAR